jgi:uncharacterized protein YjbI with pentapeptide repeats
MPMWLTISLAVTFIVALVVLAYWRHWHWTGLPAAPAVSAGAEVRSAKTLWDWLQLLGIPVALAALVFLLNDAQSSRDQRREDHRSAQQRRTARDAERESTLRTYLAQMSDLMFGHQLLRSGLGADVREVARTATLTAVRRLDGPRRGLVVQFLGEARLLRTSCAGGVCSRRTYVSATLRVASADLRGANLAGAHLRRADLRETNLAGAQVSGADLSRAHLRGVNLREAVLSGAVLTDANLVGANLRDANVSGANLIGANLRGADLIGANLRGENLSSTVLDKANLTQADVRGAAFVGADLRYALLGGANLRHALLIRADLRGVNLSKASLRQADLSGANLSGADLHGAKLSKASLRRADLRGVNLTGADLRGADLRGADILAAILSGAHGVNRSGSRGTPAREP